MSYVNCPIHQGSKWMIEVVYEHCKIANLADQKECHLALF